MNESDREFIKELLSADDKNGQFIHVTITTKEKPLEHRMPDESVLPPWMRWYAMDRNRDWYAYAKAPVSNLHGRWVSDARSLFIPPEYAPQNVPDDIDWRETLIERIDR